MPTWLSPCPNPVVSKQWVPRLDLGPKTGTCIATDGPDSFELASGKATNSGFVVPSLRPSYKPYVELGSVGSIVVWVGIYGLHLVCAAYFAAGGWLYHMLPTTTMIGNLNLYALTISMKYFPTIAVVHYILAALHCFFLVMSVAKLIHRLVVSKAKISPGSPGLDLEGLQPSIWFARVKYAARNTIARWFGRDSLFGVDSEHFETVFLVRELTETSLQTYQAYTMSRLLPRRMLNRFYVILLVINCWSTPALSFFVKHQPRQRLLCLISDILLDFVSSVWVPLYLAFSYIADYDTKRKDFPFAFWYNNEWLVNILQESQIIMFRSAVDAFSRLLYSISLLAALQDVKEFVNPLPPSDARQKTQSVTFSSASWLIPARLSSLSISSATSSRVKSLLHAAAAHRGKVNKWGHRVMIALGFAIIMLQIQAEMKADTSGCIMELRPWLTTERACAIVEMNCHQDKSLTGNRTNFDASFSHLNPLSLQFLAYRHCPQIEFGERFARFQNLFGMKVYNSTVVMWGEDAAFTQTSHPTMRVAFFLYTNFTNGELPPGLIARDFPSALRDLEFVVTNLKGFPPDIASRWTRRMSLFLERSELTTIPNEIATLQLYGISLVGNKITDLTQEILDATNLGGLVLSGNPITHISETLNASRCAILAMFLDATQVTSLPEWMDATFLERTMVFADGTPLCTDLLLRPETTATQELLSRRPHLANVMCMGSPFDGSSYFPLALEIRADEVW